MNEIKRITFIIFPILAAFLGFYPLLLRGNEGHNAVPNAVNKALANQINPATAQAVNQTLIRFYKWYFDNVDKNPSPLADPPKLGKYITKSLIRDFERIQKYEGGFEVDPFLIAQDYDKDWKNNISVEVKSANTKTANAIVHFKGHQIESNNVNVDLKFEDGAWKIDNVSGTES